MSGSGSSSSVLWQPYRSLGLVASASAAPHLKLLGSERFLTVPLGKSWCVYNLDKMRVVLMGAARSHAVRAIASMRDLTFTTAGSDIIVWRRQEEVYRLQAHQRAVYMLYLFGGLLCSVDEGQTLMVWDVKALGPAISVRSQVARAMAKSAAKNSNGAASAASPATPAPSLFIHSNGVLADADWKAEPLSVLQFPTSSRISCLLHPSTYLNKLVVGFSGASGTGGVGGGGLELWNIKTRACIYRFKAAEWSGSKHHPDKKLAETLGRSVGADSGKGKGGKESAAATESVSVTCLEQSPAVDVVAVGLHNGLVVLLNLQLDQVLHVYVHAPPASIGASGGVVMGAAAAAAPASPISSLSFRTDNNGAFLASACVGSGTVAVWDLEKKQLKTLIKSAHGGAQGGGDGVALAGSAAAGASIGAASVTIHSMFFLPSEPLLLTVGSDNAIRMWIFDKLDGTARLLKERSGHALPPTRIRFYPSERGQLDIVSAGADRALRTFSLQKDEQSRELSQGSVAAQARAFAVAEASLKLTTITDLAACGLREKDWPNIVTAHAHDCAAYTWKWSSKSLSAHKLLNTNPGAVASAVKSVAMTPCGNFGILGMHNGRIDQFNVQSGTWKATFGANHTSADQITSATARNSNASKNINLKRKAAKEAAAAGASGSDAATGSSSSSLPPNQGHTASVTGLAIDGLNRQLVSCSLDGWVLFWDFKKRSVTSRLYLGAPCSKMAYSQESDLLAVVDDNLVVHVIDALTHTVVRRFSQHTAPLTDMLFSPDSKWLLTASSDCCVRVFDLASATLLDFMRFSKPVSSLAMSPRGDFLATSHVNNLGVYLWANKAYFGTAAENELTVGATSATRRVAQNKPVRMEVKERQDGEEEDEYQEEEAMNNVKREEDLSSDDEEEASEEEEDASMDGAEESNAKKRRRANDGSSLALTSAQTPLLHLRDSDQFDLITYSSQPKSKWHTLAHLDAIKARNKPKEGVANKPKAQPFFLTALASLSNQNDGPSQAEARKLADTFGVSSSSKATAASASTSATAAAAAPALGSRTVKSGGIGLASTLVELLEQAKQELPELVKAQPDQHPRVYLIKACTIPLETQRAKHRLACAWRACMRRRDSLCSLSYVCLFLLCVCFSDSPVTTYLQGLSPSAIDGEVSALGLDPSREPLEFRLVLEYLLASLETHKNFEFVQAILNRFLKVHGTSLATYPDLLQVCERISQVQKRVWTRLEQAFQANLALVSHLAQIQM